MHPRSLSHRAPALWLLLPFMAGIVLGRATPHAPWSVATLVVAAALLSIAVWRPRTWSVVVPFALILAGASHYALSRARLADWEALPAREARLAIEVTQVFPGEPGERRVNLLARIIEADTHLTDLRGQRVHLALRSLPRGPTPIISQRLSVIGMLQRVPWTPPPASFEGYLADAGVNFRLTHTRLLAQLAPPSAYRLFCHEALQQLDAIMANGLDHLPAQSANLRAMLLGRKQELSDDQTTLYMNSGTMHLFAISGLHIAAIAAVVQSLLGIARLPNWLSVLIGTLLVWLYVDITGASPSSVRAFFMVTMLSIGRWIRLPGNALSALATSALCVLVAGPMPLFSASFQMSYAIVGAILLYGLPLGDWAVARWALFAARPTAAWTWVHRLISRTWNGLLGTLAIGLSATLVSVVSSLAYFGLITPVAMPLNVIVIPVSMLPLLAGLASMGFGLIGAEIVSVLCNHSAALVFTVIEWVLRIAMAIPGSVVPASLRATWIGPLALSGLMGTFLHGYARGWTGRRSSYWGPVVITLVILLFGVKLG